MFGGLYHPNFVSTSGFTAQTPSNGIPALAKPVSSGNHNRMPIAFPSAERKQQLVGALEPWNFIFLYIGNVIIRTDYIIFFRGVGQPPTR